MVQQTGDGVWCGCKSILLLNKLRRASTTLCPPPPSLARDLPHDAPGQSGLCYILVFTCTIKLAGITFTGDPAKNKKDLFGAIAMVLRVVGGKNSQLSLPTRYSLNTIFTSLIGLFWNTNYEFGR